MERNRSATAIRCLEVALHPSARDDEVIAAVNGFRRTANGTPLRAVCAALFGGSNPEGAAGLPAEWRERVDRLYRENRDLRRKAEVQESNQIIAARRLHEAERRIRVLNEELSAARQRAADAERRVAEIPPVPPQEAPMPFQHVLAAARRREDRVEAAVSYRRAGPDHGRDPGSSPVYDWGPDSPWTA